MVATSRARRLLPAAVMWVVGLAAVALLWLPGDEFYRMSLAGDDERFLLADYPQLRASGSHGHALGIAGGIIILVNLAYLLRRHVRGMARLGSLRAWMAAHVLTGLLGLALVALHAGFHAGNLFHLAAAGSLVLLVATGLAGRFVYAMVPHDRAGEEVPVGELARHLVEGGLRDEATLRSRLRRGMRLRRLLSAWRDVHRPMAMVMATAATAHVVVAWLSRRTIMAEAPLAVHLWTFGSAGAVLAGFAAFEVVLVRRRRRRGRDDLDALVRAELRGLNTPVSLHPVVDLSVCMGSAACVAACPEGDVLGLVNGHAQLLHGAHCVGHGRCAAECPTGAISLVFGTSKRGVDIPHVSASFESNVPGIFITGELGGMGLIRNAVRQSGQAVEHIARHRPRGGGGILDLVVVGAGPAGMAAALFARKHGLAFEVLDQEPQAPGGAINHYPRRKVVMTSPFELPGYGRSEATVLSKEQLVDLWLGALAANGIEVRCAEKVEDVRAVDVGMPAARGAVPPDAGAFDVVTAKGVRRARTALLCVGRRGSPRRLDVPGEDLPNVAYRVAEPEQYAGSRVLVVGGGDAAIEGAIAVAGAGAASVTLSYRQAAVARVREANRVAFEQATADGRVRFEGESQVVAIAPDAVTLRRGGTTWDVGNDFVIVQIGGVLPLEFLARIGVSVEKKFGTA